MSDKSQSSHGVGFAGLLTLVFIVLKLIGKITWSWWWVLSPVWISIALAIVVMALCGVGLLVLAMKAAK